MTGDGARTTVWVLGDQLTREAGPLRDHRPQDGPVLVVDSAAKRTEKPWHAQRLHLVYSAMAHFVAELRADGFEVDHRRAPTLRAGLDAHRAEHDPARVVATSPSSYAGRELLAGLGVELAVNEQFLCSSEAFAEWAEGRRSLTMEDFYRWQRSRLGILMDGDEPAGGRWNFDHDNREPPPRDGRAWPELTRFPLDDIDRAVLDDLPAGWGAPADGTWPVTRDQARQRLDEFVTHALPGFGAHEDAMLEREWKLAHSALSTSLNLGLLHPLEVVDAAEAAWRSGDAPINSVEGFIRQVIGWREFVWGVYWLWMPEYRGKNELHATRPVPPAFRGEAPTEMNCVRGALAHVHDHGYTHHIERLMVLGNLALTAGVDPWAMTEWMWAGFVDGAEWVMLPNVVGMALHADGGMMATKPYASGGAYINRMSDYCKGCRFDPKQRVGEDACPYTTLYWDFLARNEDRFRSNHRMSRPLAGMRRLSDLPAVRERAREVLVRLDAGEL